MAKPSMLVIFQLCSTLLVLIHAQDQSGFISIDCGLVDEASYRDETTGINYTSDTNLIDSGVSISISSQYKAESLERQLWNVRSFPEGTKNCYTNYLSRVSSSKRLIRARFMYGNYDGRNSPPRFDLYLGPSWWSSVELENSSTVISKEMVLTAMSDYIHVCLVNTNMGIPFISALEIRVLKNDSYDDGTLSGRSWELLERFDVGLRNDQMVRYPNDVYDRIWTPYNYELFGWKEITTSANIRSQGSFMFQVPSIVLRTAATPTNRSENMRFYYESDHGVAQRIYFKMYFAEIEELLNNQTRDFNIYLNGKLKFRFTTSYLGVYSIYWISSAPAREVWLNRTNTSTEPPCLNAIEVYRLKLLNLSETDQNDVDAVIKIKSMYEVKRNWQGDPCSPQNETWNGLSCRYDVQNPPKIISLNLSSSGLTGKIAADISNLKLIQHLDLSNNSLTGPVLDSLSQLNSLKILNLENNKLSGPIPANLIERSRNGSLTLSTGGNPNLCSWDGCHSSNKVVILSVVISIAAFILSAAAVAFWIHRRQQVVRRKNVFCMDSTKQEFTYSELQSITNNFLRVVGKGGFGTVYHGCIADTQVAVKMLSPSTQGYQQFQAEAKIFARVHHKCLTPLIGYCNEGPNMAVIYEFMPNGNLAEHLSDKSQNLLSWEQRLQIALDSAVGGEAGENYVFFLFLDLFVDATELIKTASTGLEYLHNGCKPPIVHRDIKPTNILLNGNFRGKISDFGLSRIFSDENDTHVSTVIAGTPGYVDPEYYRTNRLNEKSDVFSFGVVLMEIITGRPAVSKTVNKTHVIQWVSSLLVDGDVSGIIDPRLQGDYDTESARKIIDVAMVCVAPASVDRPTMNNVVMELKQCLPMKSSLDSTSLIEGDSINFISGESSLAR